MNQNFDYIIVGAGSAGCVLANRLSEDKNKRVLLLETGGSDRSIFIQMPTALSIPMNTQKYAWQFETEPEPGLDNRRMHCPRGKVLGGSSSINGMVYVRGHAHDFDEWQASGAEAGATPIACPISKRPRLGPLAVTSIEAIVGPWGSTTATAWLTPCIRPLLMPVCKPGTWPQMITTVLNRKALAPCI